MNTVGKAGPARRAGPLRRLGLDADRGLGHQHRHPHPRRARLRHPAPLRAGRRPRAAPSVLRPERGRPVRRRICRHPGHPVRLHRQAGGREARSRRARRSASTRSSERDALEIRFPRVEGYRSSCPTSASTPSSPTTRALEADARAGRPVRGAAWKASSARASTLDLEYLEEMRPARPRIPSRQAPALHASSAIPASSPSCISSASSSASCGSGSTSGYLVCKGGTYPGAARSIRRSPTRRPTGSSAPSARAHGGEKRDQGDPRPLQPRGLDAVRQLHHQQDRPLADRARRAATSTGWSATATGRPSSPGRRGPSARASPTSRTRASASRCPIATARSRGATCPTSSCRSTTARRRAAQPDRRDQGLSRRAMRS